jgi:hypothetical protein
MQVAAGHCSPATTQAAAVPTSHGKIDQIASLCALVAAASAAEKTCTAINADRTDKIACTREIYFVLL